MDALEPVRLTEAVAHKIREQILDGRLSWGEPLRADDVAHSLQVSATPVREALTMLEKEGLVEHLARRGFRVAKLTAQDLLDSFALHAELSATLAVRALEAITTEELERLRALDKGVQLAAAERRSDDVATLNFEFHRIISLAAPDSAVLRRFLREADHYMPRTMYAEIPGWLDAAVHDHGRIVAALEAREPNQLADAIRVHVREGGELLAEHLIANRGLPRGDGSPLYPFGAPVSRVAANPL
jgi:DNA-binding GntR family transcriptional regulator